MENQIQHSSKGREFRATTAVAGLGSAISDIANHGVAAKGPHFGSLELMMGISFSG